MLDINASVHKFAPKLVNKLPAPLLKLFIKTLQIIFHEKLFFSFYDKNKHLSGLPFVTNMLENLKVSCTVRPNEMKNIPSTGKLIVIANHPTGAVDTMVLIETIASAREDKKIKIVANGMVMGIKQISSLLIPVDNINGAITKHSLKIVNEALANDEAIIIFPSGLVDRLTLKGIKDSTWKASFLKIAKRTQTPILPLKISGRNSILFYILSILLPKSLSALFLVHEFAIAGKRKPIHINIGKVIPFTSFSDKNISINEYIDMFFSHVYKIGTKYGDVLETETTIANTNNTKKLKEEVYKARFLGNSNDGKRIILANAEDSPFLISELGRLREISFRAIGGGTGNTHDNDKYDNYYKHLILWDDIDLEIVGAYRIGQCKEIIEAYGTDGLYTSKLCTYSKDFLEILDRSIELGRSFVQPKYWGTRAFENLWQAVTVYLAYHPEIQYSYGSITINGNTPPKATAALVYFYSLHFAHEKEMMAGINPYIIKDEDRAEFDKMFKDHNYKDGFVILKKYLKSLNTIVPTLFKQYVEFYEAGYLNYFGFNVNKGWGNVVEGFIFADAYAMKKSIKSRNLKEFNKIKDIDPLTKLHSRDYFTHQVASICQYNRATDTKSSLIVFDIHSNYENEINNKLLQRVARTLQNSLRQDDLVARWDDKAFIIMLKNTNPSKAMCISQNLKNAIEDIKINAKYSIECSFKAIEQDCINCQDENESTHELLVC